MNCRHAMVHAIREGALTPSSPAWGIRVPLHCPVLPPRNSNSQPIAAVLAAAWFRAHFNKIKAVTRWAVYGGDGWWVDVSPGGGPRETPSQ